MSTYITTQATVESEQGSLSLARIGYQDLGRSGTVTASSAQTDFPADAAQRPDTYEAWKPSAVQAYWENDLGADQAVNYLGIAGHTLGSTGCRIWVEAAVDGSPQSAFSVVTDNAEPSDDSVILLLFPSTTARWWRVYVDGTDSPTVAPSAMPKLGHIRLGSVLTMERKIYGGHTPIKLARETVLLRAMSRGGHFLAQNFRRRGYRTNAAWRHLTASFYRNSFDPFVQEARQYPFFFAWRPGDWPDEVAYAWAEGDIAPSNMGINTLMSVELPMRGADDE